MTRAPFSRFAIRTSAPGRRPSAADLVASVLDALHAGRLTAGCRLPPVRVIEQQHGVSKNTVMAAYDELTARGVVVSRARDGVFVAHPSGMTPPDADSPRRAARTPLREPPSFSTTGPRDALRLSTVFIDPALLPTERLADCARSVLRTPGLEAFYDPQGFAPLREQIAARLSARGMRTTASQVILTTGSQQALDIVARALHTRSIAVEDPVYSYARLLFENVGAQTTPLTLDPFAGIDLPRWSAALERARPSMLYAITSFQNPTGYSYTTHELEAVLECTARLGVGLLEDDWGSDMLSGSELRPTLRGLGGDEVLYVNSFTKKLLPSLRLGYLVAPDELVPTLVAMKRLSTLGNNSFSEALLSEFLDRGYYDTHLTALQRALDERYEHCVDALRTHMPEGCRWTLPGGGPTLWLDLPREVDLDAVAAWLAAHGVHVESTASHFAATPHLHGFRVSYAWLSREQLTAAITLVARALQCCASTAPASVSASSR